ncbi:MAG: hypothetical protein HRU18_01230 [Pseudoalteromonas sp.]|uniref:hypothetical protein n=1 Tax=Pseudoalteromonas sp. TaxID=53249 RepID=UPI001DA16E2F|nr:hypothetical protein [Pseudoalteromonas sp.]NRA76802.1 hypothetical protein [Pseudoalteromonas sp.]
MKSFKMYNTVGVEQKLKELGYKLSAKGKNGNYGAYIYCVAKTFTITPAMYYWHGLDLPLAELVDGELVEAVTTIEISSNRKTVEDKTLIADVVSQTVDDNWDKLKDYIPANCKLDITVNIRRNIK